MASIGRRCDKDYRRGLLGVTAVVKRHTRHEAWPLKACALQPVVGHFVSLRLAKAARLRRPIHETNDRAPLAVVWIARGAAGLLPLVPLGVVPSARVGYGGMKSSSHQQG
jgi:hypothetical protein